MRKSITIKHKNGDYNLAYSIGYTERTKVWHLFVHHSSTYTAMYDFNSKKEAEEYLQKLQAYFSN